MKLIKLIAFAVLLCFDTAHATGPSFEPVTGVDILTGKPVTAAPGSKGLVIAFLSAKCPCSMSHIPELNELATQFKDFSFIGVHSNMDENEQLSRAYFAKTKLPFPVIADSNAKLADRFKALKTPHVFVVASDGRILFQGGMSDSKDCANADRHYLKEALGDLHAGKPVREASVRSLGCTISRRKSG